jgi:hypothetical protein
VYGADIEENKSSSIQQNAPIDQTQAVQPVGLLFACELAVGMNFIECKSVD